MIISVGSKLPVTLLEENQTTPVTPTSADGNFNSSTDVVLDLGVGADVPLLTDDLLQSPSPIRITRSFSDSSLAHHPPPSASFISSIASKARSVASSALARSLKKDRQKQQSLPRRPLNILCSMSISHLCRISLFFAGLYLVFLYIYTVQNLRQPSEELLGVGLLGEGGLSYINNSDHLIVDVASDTPKSSSNNNNSSIDSVIHQNHNHKHLGSDTIDAIQHALSPYPSFPDITAEAFNLLPTKCKIFIQGQVPGNDQRISPDGNDGDDFGEVTKWKRENPGKALPEWFNPIPRSPTSKRHIPQQIFFIHYNPQLKNAAFLCSVESAALHHPHHTISIHVRNYDGFINSDVYKKWMFKIPPALHSQIKIKTIDYTKLFSNTPLSDWYTSGSYNKSHWIDQNLGNAVRLAIMWSQGGIYMDMDIITTNSFQTVLDDGGRMIVREDGAMINNALLVFPEKDPFIAAAMKTFVKKWNGYQWGNNGPVAIARTVINECHREMRGDDDWDFFHRKWDKNAPSFRFSVKPQTPSKDVCEGLVVANRKRAYPLLYNQMNRFKEDWKSKDCENIANINDQALGLHFWNKVIKFKGGEGISINSLLIKVMQKNCPVISHTQLIPLLNL